MGATPDATKAGAEICFRFDEIPASEVEAKIDRIVEAVVAHAADRRIVIHSVTRRSRLALARFARLEGIRVRPFEPEATAPATASPFVPCMQALVLVDDPSMLASVLRDVRKRSHAVLYAYSPRTHVDVLAATTPKAFKQRVGVDPARFGWSVKDYPCDPDWFDAFVGFATGLPPDTGDTRSEMTTWGPSCPADLRRAALE